MLNRTDRPILKELQDNFPVESRPYFTAARRLGLTEAELVRKVKSLKKRKLVRYCGAIFEGGKLGVRSTLIALSVPKSELKRVVKIINAYPQVSHNYLRRGRLNLWFTLSAPSRRELSGIIRRIKKSTGMDEMLELGTEKVFKINARFNF